jgi:phage tail-like protein
MAVTRSDGTEDVLVSFFFELKVGSVQGMFTEVSGIGSEHEVVSHNVVQKGFADVVRKVPGRLKWGDITLKRGITSNLDMYQWRKQVEDGQINEARKDGSILMYSQEGSLVAQWDFVRGWPSKVTGPSLQTESNAVGVEEMTIVHEGIVRST